MKLSTTEQIIVRAALDKHRDYLQNLITTYEKDISRDDALGGAAKRLTELAQRDIKLIDAMLADQFYI